MSLGALARKHNSLGGTNGNAGEVEELLMNLCVSGYICGGLCAQDIRDSLVSKQGRR